MKKCEYEYENCKNTATKVAVSNETGKVGMYCDYHADLVANLKDPQYVIRCPHCGCIIPVDWGEINEIF